MTTIAIAIAIAIVGAGRGLGATVARRFGSEGFDVALLSRSQGALACGLFAVRLRGRRTQPRMNTSRPAQPQATRGT